MLARSKYPLPPPKIQKIAHTFSWYGWLSLWIQLGLAFASIVILLFAASGRKFSPDASTTGIGIGIFWSVCSFLVLWVTIFFAFRYTRIAKGLLREPDTHLHPRKSDTVQLLRFAVIVGFVGILLGLVGAGSSLGVLIAKTISQPPGMAITHPDRIVRALDVFVVVANFNLITAHFVGAATSMWLLEKLHSNKG
ncbi:MAG: DUF3611 family protein [Xenococcaceae cyanobacterium MO_207.B15]|nr:DUF3611 family protein [Xenococcaceae cyanobacterium MO_207.B15]MDJ0746986.1 DUF3611 family protein [Xenococcaceae cyanobacterium MO_167.B27]